MASGWNGSGEISNPQKPKVATKKPSPIRGLIAGLLVCAVAGACYFLFFFSDAGKPQRGGRGDGRIKDVAKPPAPKNVKASDVKTVQDKVVAKTVREAAEATATEVRQESAEAVTNAVAQDEKPKKKPVFVNGTDQLIAMATGVPEGCTIPPLPNMTSADTDRFTETLKKPIQIDEKDSDAVKAAKERVQQVREQIAQWMQEEPGKELGAILNEHRDDFNHVTDMQNEVKKGLQEYLDAGDDEGAKKYLTMMNLALQQVGVPEVEMPKDEEESENEGETTNE